MALNPKTMLQFEFGALSLNLVSCLCIAQKKLENRRKKSLALLIWNFVKLFVCIITDLISLNEDARLLLGDAHNSSIMRSN
ncbi:E2F Family [Trema orientale]|uniref:E2F Family n=1 Tax=Trema orientale TaxID=63057 RepID=A0A2P5DNH0_TREOI|nr:E2F Family [Trema orientale]